jgi:hypothetical protein
MSIEAREFVSLLNTLTRQEREQRLTDLAASFEKSITALCPTWTPNQIAREAASRVARVLAEGRAG